MYRKRVAAVIVLASHVAAQAYWHSLMSDDFSVVDTNAWSYEGVTNAAGDPLIGHPAGASEVHAEWSQSNLYVGAGDPYTIVPSRFARRLARRVTDRDTFRAGATLNLATGSVANTWEFHQIANIGVYGLVDMGPDRTMSDNWSGNSALLKDASDFVEFNYFINNCWGGPNITAVIGAHIEGVDGAYTTGTNMAQTAMGEDHWLPEGSNLYVEVSYFGGETGALARVAHCAIYTEPERTNLVVVNGVGMSYWTQALPTNEEFTATHFAFFNYAGANWGGANAEGAGAFDDAYVRRWVPPGEVFSNSVEAGGMVITWAAVSGSTYQVECCADLAAGGWTPVGVVTALAETACWTNALAAQGGYCRVTQ